MSGAMVRGAMMLGATLLLGACTVGYTVDVRNDTAQPIGVAIVHGNSGGQLNALAVQRIGPNSRGQVVRNNVPYDWPMFLEIDAQGNPGFPPQIDLKTGLTVVRVTQDGNVPTGKMHLERIERE